MEDARRKRARVEVGPGVSDVPSPFDSLPDEMLVAIFQHVDSVTRRNVASVCRRWKSLLRETSSLRKVVKIDMSILPVNSPLQPQQPTVYPGDGETLLMATVRVLLKKHPTADTLHIYDSAPSTTTVRALHGTSAISSEKKRASLGHLLAVLVRHSDRDFPRAPLPVRVMKTIILDDLPVNLYDVNRWLEQPACSALTLRDVEICGVAMDKMRGYGRYHEVAVCGEIGDRVVNCRFVAGPSAAPMFVAALAEKEAPLAASEEVVYMQVMTSLEQQSMECAMVAEYAEYVEQRTGHVATGEDVLNGPAVLSFWRRLVIAGRDWLENLLEGDEYQEHW